MNVKKIEHGATVKFSATFIDAEGLATVPASAVVVISFTDIATGTTTRATVNMTNVSGAFEASWDSSAAARDKSAFWNIRAADTNKISEFGRIDFDQNEAGLPD